jgi:hypothetical protein
MVRHKPPTKWGFIGSYDEMPRVVEFNLYTGVLQPPQARHRDTAGI